MKFELDGQKRACCLPKPFTYADLLESIRKLFGNQILSAVDSILCIFSRDDALRLPVANDDDLSKVIAIAESNRATKLNFLLTRRQGYATPQLTPTPTNEDIGCVSDDGHQAEAEDARMDSPPPGTIAAHRRRTATNATSKSTAPNDGGFFIPESVRSFACVTCGP